MTTPLPPLYQFQGPLRVADTATAFEQAVEAFLRDPGLRVERQEIARAASWPRRVDLFYERMLATLPALDVVVLTHGNAELTQRCLASLSDDSSYRPPADRRRQRLDRRHARPARRGGERGRDRDPEPDERRLRTRPEPGRRGGLGPVRPRAEQRHRDPARRAARLRARAGTLAGGRAARARDELDRQRGRDLRPVRARCERRHVRMVPAALLGTVRSRLRPEAPPRCSRRSSGERTSGRRAGSPSATRSACSRTTSSPSGSGGSASGWSAPRTSSFTTTGGAAFRTLDPVVYQAIFDRNRRVYEDAVGAPWQPHTTGRTSPARSRRRSSRARVYRGRISSGPPRAPRVAGCRARISSGPRTGG